ncbi:cytochrome P450 [Actinomadura physcomitrii]|uniref:cytochrome P450 n=1 Tax=Actinomadura physcomitrii TaxID=2650748 RepID=UPI001371C878|nr:cytochrome P450 [Actinomadura physcomitrii]
MQEAERDVAVEDEAEWFLTPGDPRRGVAREDPYPLYARLREQRPVLECSQKRWLVTRYADVLGVLRGNSWSRDELAAEGVALDAATLPPSRRLSAFSLLRRDPPDHTRLRRVVAPFFTARGVARWRARVDELTRDLLEAVRDKDSFDFYAEVSRRLPVMVICELLGVPADDMDEFARWAATTLSVLEPGDDPAAVQAAREAAATSCLEFFNALADERVRSTRRPDDLISHMIGVDEDRLSRDELVSTAVMLHIAGHETTANLVSNGLLTLLRHEDQFELLRSDPSLVPNAVEEMLRFDSPARNALTRIAVEPVEVGGVTIPRGDTVYAVLGSANRDGATFTDPDTFDVSRTNNPHLAFGSGIHYCLGANLARIEAQAVFTRLITDYPRLRLVAEPRWRDSFVLRALEGLEVAWE